MVAGSNILRPLIQMQFCPFASVAMYLSSYACLLVESLLFTIYENLIVLYIGAADDMVFDLCKIGLLDRPGNGRSHLEHISKGIMHNLGLHTSVLELDTKRKLIVRFFTYRSDCACDKNL